MTEILKKENNKVYFDIEISAEELKKQELEVYKKNKSSIQIPGFRKGHAPLRIIEQFYGKGVFLEDAVNDLLPKKYEEAVKELNLEVVDSPEVDFDKVEEGKDLLAHISVDVKPEIELPDYKGMEVEEVNYQVTDELINNDLENQRRMNARIVNVDNRPAQKGDKVNINFTGSIDGVEFEGGKAENQDLELGSNTFIPGFEDQIVGKNIGDEFDVIANFPKDYHAKELAGKEATFKTKLNSISLEELPEVDDEFIKDISDFDTVDEYKKDLREKREKEFKDRTEAEKKARALKTLASKVQVEVPNGMIEDEIENMVNSYNQNLGAQGLKLDQYLGMLGTNLKDFKENLKPQARENVVERLTLDAIIKKEGFEVSDEEIEKEVDQVLETYFNKDEEKKKDMKHIMLEHNKEAVKNDLLARRAVEKLVEECKFVEKKETEEKKSEKIKEEKPKAKKTTKKSETKKETKKEETSEK